MKISNKGLNLENLTKLIIKKPAIDHEVMIDSEGVFWTTDGCGKFWFWSEKDSAWNGDKFPRNDLVTVKYLECFFKPNLASESNRFNLKCSYVDFGCYFEKKFAATYSEAVQIGEHEYKQVRTTKIFYYRDSFLKIIEWLESIGVKNPDINSVEISGLDE